MASGGVITGGRVVCYYLIVFYLFTFLFLCVCVCIRVSTHTRGDYFAACSSGLLFLRTTDMSVGVFSVVNQVILEPEGHKFSQGCTSCLLIPCSVCV